MAKVTTQAIRAGEPMPAEPVAAASAPVAPEIKAPMPVPIAAALTAAAVNAPPSSETVAPPQPDVPLRPGLETPAAPVPETDPFVLLESWKGTTTARSLRALEVPGGCIVRLSAANGPQLVESLCFVPCVNIADGKLAPTKCCDSK